ncbi:hypothetical protein PVAG01_09014 [Phlyctema vagabunda]|uniref:NADH dehydrogenase subunit 4 n=1 Tax=Phlyctema vagabunda TaxID=108571 RepID=A0ABR4P676_9HELO
MVLLSLALVILPLPGFPLLSTTTSRRSIMMSKSMFPHLQAH